MDLNEAVIAGDAAAVRSLLEDGADPNALGPDGLPLLCAAVAGFDHGTAEVLVEAGADADRELPDGTTPLLRAVDLGSPALVGALLGSDPGAGLPETSRRRLLDSARHWWEVGEEEELRRRTGASGPAVRRWVEDEYTDVEEVSLGDLAVRVGHSGVLTALEQAFGIAAPVTELVARAVPYPEACHANWSAARFALGGRSTPQDWSELVVLRHHPDPVHRRLLADVLGCRHFFAGHRARPDTDHDVEFLADWVLDEPDGSVLAVVLGVYTDWGHAGQEAVGLRYADHADPRVRSEVPYCLSRDGIPPSEAATAALLALSYDPDPAVRAVIAQVPGHPGEFTPNFRAALLRLIQDPDPGVRVRSAETLSASPDRTPEVTEALAALLDEEDQLMRLEGACALARRDDPRTEEAYERVGPLGPGFGIDHRVNALWHYRSRSRLS
ncbi:HEAT repeat domain-containing protein [Kitasatospora sp. NPDC048296]|uniref:HEAT repeat domain-containing protein n=1 Tax=Kitasatospora sp. NPDC048296 TaxID=3364048 RepID=UPI0037241618